MTYGPALFKAAQFRGGMFKGQLWQADNIRAAIGAVSQTWTLSGFTTDVGTIVGPLAGAISETWADAGIIVGLGRIAGSASQTWTDAGAIIGITSIFGSAAEAWALAGNLGVAGTTIGVLAGSADQVWALHVIVPGMPASGLQCAVPKERPHVRARERCHGKSEGRQHARVKEALHG